MLAVRPEPVVSLSNCLSKLWFDRLTMNGLKRSKVDPRLKPAGMTVNKNLRG